MNHFLPSFCYFLTQCFVVVLLIEDFLIIKIHYIRIRSILEVGWKYKLMERKEQGKFPVAERLESLSLFLKCFYFGQSHVM